jgi:hypothetical protein
MILVSQTKTSHIIVIMYNTTRGLSIDNVHHKSSCWVSEEITYCTSLLTCIWHGIGGFDRLIVWRIGPVSVLESLPSFFYSLCKRLKVHLDFEPKSSF